MRIPKYFLIAVLTYLSFQNVVCSQSVPKVYNNLVLDDVGNLYYQIENGYIPEYKLTPVYTLEKLQANPKATKTGIAFDLKDKNFNGLMYYGFIPYGDSKHPYPVYFNLDSEIIEGKATIDILNSILEINDPKANKLYQITGMKFL